VRKKSLTVKRICQTYGLSRSGYYKAGRATQKHQLQSDILLELIGQIRKILPRVGGRKLYHMLEEDLVKASIKIGRDRFFSFLRQENLLIKAKKKYARTTNSSHRFRTYNNLLENKQISQSHQAWVCDITYIRTLEGFSYLALITDAYSRKIVGYDFSDSLELEGCKRALLMAIGQLPTTYQLIHHSDRGFQYCSNVYTHILNKHNIQISMAEKGNCYENAMAERVNGILKQEFFLDENFKSKVIARKAVDQAIWNYNEIRPHFSINLLTPTLKHAA
jgi:putative transposase